MPPISELQAAPGTSRSFGSTKNSAKRITDSGDALRLTQTEMKQMVTFSEKDLLGGWKIAVILNGSTIGNIRMHGQGGYAYFRGPNNVLTWSIQDGDLEALKEKVAASLG
jgi:hypothetical protein